MSFKSNDRGLTSGAIHRDPSDTVTESREINIGELANATERKSTQIYKGRPLRFSFKRLSAIAQPTHLSRSHQMTAGGLCSAKKMTLESHSCFTLFSRASQTHFWAPVWKLGTVMGYFYVWKPKGVTSISNLVLLHFACRCQFLHLSAQV